MLMFFTKAMLILHTFVGVILIGIILLQRGRGGGLAGAFGGMGGQSAFGTKAGDVFTKITIYIASVWIVLGCVCVIMTSEFKSNSGKAQLYKGSNAADVKGAAAEDADAKKDQQPADKKPAGDKAGDEAVPPGPGPQSPPPAKTETKTEAPAGESKAEPKAESQPEGDAAKPSEKGEAKPAEPKPAEGDKPAESTAKEGDAAPPKDSTEKKPE
jgi:preprotein translocase subunit SecG